MSKGRSDPHKARIRRERIRHEKHQPPGEVFRGPTHPFATERAMREIHALLEGETFEDVDEINARLAELNRDGRLSERANAWKRDDPKWRAQQLAYDALETDDFAEALQLIHDALELDPDCTDANRLMVSLIPADIDNKLQLMREVLTKAELSLGEKFHQYQGRFWGEIETRPYMRVILHLAELLVETGRLEEAISTYERILELNPDDNQGVRNPLLGLLLANNQFEDAGRLLTRYEEEDVLGVAAWGRVLQRWLSGDLEQAEAALGRARKVNRFAEAYLSGKRAVAAELPDHFQPGQESEAQICGKELQPACERHAGFRQWLLDHRVQ